MKILHVISSLKIGGAETALYNFLQSVQSKGNEHIVAFFHDGPYREKIEALGIKTYGINGWLYRYDPGAYFYLKKLVRSCNPDVIHSALWSANILSRILASHCHIPVICDLHGNCIDEGRFRNLLDRLTTRKAFAIVAVSNTVHAAYKDHVYNHPNLITIQNGINIARVKKRASANPLSREELGIPSDAFVIGAVGRLEPIKSYDVLLHAFAKFCKRINSCAHAELVEVWSASKRAIAPPRDIIVGAGSERKELESLCQTLGIQDRVMFVGMRPDAQRFYPLFDCFALSSHSEGLSIALLEALCFGLPVITTHAFAHHDVITYGVNGFLIPPNDIDTYAKHLELLYKQPNLCAKMRKANADLVHKQFSLDATVNAYVSLYQKAYIPRL